VSRGHDDYHVEPIRGLPENLPPGEEILWQGAPLWWQLAKDVFHIRAAACYFGALMAWRASVRMTDAGDGVAALAAVCSLLPVALIGIGLLALLAWLSSRTTVYTITNRRIVLRIGVALTTAVNIPFCVVSAAGFCPRAGGTGNISLALSGDHRVAYSNLWPHVRPWRLAAPEPMLRAIPQAAEVATLLAAALRDAALPSNVVRLPGATAARAKVGGADLIGGEAVRIPVAATRSSRR
jgi:hypothetical protein